LRTRILRGKPMTRGQAASAQNATALKLRFGAAVGTGIGVLVGLVALTTTTTETPAEAAGPNAADGGVMSTYVAHAQRGEVVPPDLDDVEHMCALLTSCDKLPIPPGMVPTDFKDCVKKFTDEMTSPGAIAFSLTMRECGLQSNSCANLRACALHGANPDACQGRGKQGVVGFCDVDGRAISCFNGQILGVRDCTRGGEQCIVAGGDAKCTLGPCPGTIKDGDKPVCSASGTHKLQCEKGKLVSLDCAAFGLHCATAADGTAGCATSGAACTGTAKRCDGNVAVGCFDGHEVRVDCGAGGMTCSPVPGATPVGACVAPPPPPPGGCDPSAAPKCDGANIKYCFAGKARSYFCKALGFNKCDGGKNGVRCAM
jgi:hypothetical protein